MLRDLNFGLLHIKSFPADASFGDSPLTVLLSAAPLCRGQ